MYQKFRGLVHCTRAPPVLKSYTLTILPTLLYLDSSSSDDLTGVVVLTVVTVLVTTLDDVFVVVVDVLILYLNEGFHNKYSNW